MRENTLWDHLTNNCYPPPPPPHHPHPYPLAISAGNKRQTQVIIHSGRPQSSFTDVTAFFFFCCIIRRPHTSRKIVSHSENNAIFSFFFLLYQMAATCYALQYHLIHKITLSSPSLCRVRITRSRKISSVTKSCKDTIPEDQLSHKIM